MEFIDWLNTEINTRGWTSNELARRAELSSGAISLVLSGQRSPGPDFCLGIARALRIPPERVFRQAGLLPPYIIGDEDEKNEHELIDYYRTLTPHNRNTILTLARALHEQQSEYTTKGDKTNGQT